MGDFEKWSDSVSYGSRWIVESVFSAIKRMFGEEVRSKEAQYASGVDAQGAFVQQICDSMKRKTSAGKYGIASIYSTEH